MLGSSAMRFALDIAAAPAMLEDDGRNRHKKQKRHKRRKRHKGPKKRKRRTKHKKHKRDTKNANDTRGVMQDTRKPSFRFYAMGTKQKQLRLS